MHPAHSQAKDPMSRIRIDLDSLIQALSDHSSEWVLDTQTGEALMAEWVRDPDLRDDIGLEAGDEADVLDPLESERFIPIEPVPSHEGFRWMERFAAAQEERVRERLMDSLDRPHPFRRFKDALLEFPEVREAWFAYEEEKLKEEARAWLEYQQIDAEFAERAPPPAAG